MCPARSTRHARSSMSRSSTSADLPTTRRLPVSPPRSSRPLTAKRSRASPDDPDTELPVDGDVPQQFEETVTPEYASDVDDAGVEPDDGSVPEPSHSEAEGFDDAEAQAFVDAAAIESAAEPVHEAEESESASDDAPAPEERSDDAFRPVDETVAEPSDEFTDPTSDGWTEEPEFLQLDEADDETSGERSEPVSETDDEVAQLEDAERSVGEQAIAEQPAEDESEEPASCRSTKPTTRRPASGRCRAGA